MKKSIVLAAVIVLGIGGTAGATRQHMPDKCSNIEGVQSSVPEGFVLKDELCVKAEPQKQEPVKPVEQPAPSPAPQPAPAPAPAPQPVLEQFQGK